MQNEKQPPTSPKDQGTLKKWLPAIALALAIHTLLLIVFFNSQKNADSEAAVQTTKAPTASEDLEHEKEVLLTLIEERTVTKTEEESAENNSDDPDSDESKDDSKKEESAKSESDAKTEEDKKDSDKGDNGNSKNKKESQKNVTQNSSQKQQNTSPPLDSGAYTPQPMINPNDAVLLPRDLPQVEQTPIIGNIGNTNYANTAQQSQDLSDQLSSAVNEIKEQKLREIEKQQQASKAAYLKNQPASAQPETTGPETTEAETSEPATNSSD